jgi:K+-sensing histidine kinase KdpD
MKIRKLSLRMLVWLGVGWVIVIWINDSIVDYHKESAGSFWKHLISTSYDDLQLRLVVIISAGLIVFLLNKIRKNQDAYNDRLKKNAEDTKRFAYFITHDLKSPAIANYGLIKKISERYGDNMDARGQELCQIIMKSSEEMLDLVEKLNAYIKTKESVLNIQLVSLDEILNTIKEQIAPEIAKRRILWEVPQKEIKLRADAFLLLRAIRNLVNNSIKHGGDGLNRICIECERNEKGYEIKVIDNGRGINVVNPELLFDPFERMEESFNVEGIGLGLAIAKEAAVKHGGKIWFKPTHGGGVTFFISLSDKI